MGGRQNIPGSPPNLQGSNYKVFAQFARKCYLYPAQSRWAPSITPAICLLIFSAGCRLGSRALLISCGGSSAALGCVRPVFSPQREPRACGSFSVTLRGGLGKKSVTLSLPPVHWPMLVLFLAVGKMNEVSAFKKLFFKNWLSSCFQHFTHFLCIYSAPRSIFLPVLLKLTLFISM